MSDPVRTVSKSITLFVFRRRCKTSFKVVYNRKDLLKDIGLSLFEHQALFLISTFSEIIKFSNLSYVFILKFLDLFF